MVVQSCGFAAAKRIDLERLGAPLASNARVALFPSLGAYSKVDRLTSNYVTACEPSCALVYWQDMNYRSNTATPGFPHTQRPSRQGSETSIEKLDILDQTVIKNFRGEKEAMGDHNGW